MSKLRTKLASEKPEVEIAIKKGQEISNNLDKIISLIENTTDLLENKEFKSVLDEHIDISETLQKLDAMYIDLGSISLLLEDSLTELR